MENLFTVSKSKNTVTHYRLAESSDLFLRTHIANPMLDEVKRVRTDNIQSPNRIHLLRDNVYWGYYIDEYPYEYTDYSCHLIDRHYLIAPLSAAFGCLVSTRLLKPKDIALELERIGLPKNLSSHNLEYITDILRRTTSFEKETFDSLESLIELMLSLDEEERHGDYKDSIEGLSLREALTRDSECHVIRQLKKLLERSEDVQSTILLFPQIEERAKTISMLPRKTK